MTVHGLGYVGWAIAAVQPQARKTIGKRLTERTVLFKLCLVAPAMLFWSLVQTTSYLGPGRLASARVRR